jgi:hypothetical protein
MKKTRRVKSKMNTQNALSRVASLQELRDRLPLKEYTDLVSKFYLQASTIDPLLLSPVKFHDYKVWMDVTRKMQNVIDQDGGMVPPTPLPPYGRFRLLG